MLKSLLIQDNVGCHCLTKRETIKPPGLRIGILAFEPRGKYPRFHGTVKENHITENCVEMLWIGLHKQHLNTLHAQDATIPEQSEQLHQGSFKCKKPPLSCHVLPMRVQHSQRDRFPDLFNLILKSWERALNVLALGVRVGAYPDMIEPAHKRLDVGLDVRGIFLWQKRWVLYAKTANEGSTNQRVTVPGRLVCLARAPGGFVLLQVAVWKHRGAAGLFPFAQPAFCLLCMSAIVGPEST